MESPSATMVPLMSALTSIRSTHSSSPGCQPGVRVFSNTYVEGNGAPDTSAVWSPALAEMKQPGGFVSGAGNERRLRHAALQPDGSRPDGDALRAVLISDADADPRPRDRRASDVAHREVFRRAVHALERRFPGGETATVTVLVALGQRGGRHEQCSNRQRNRSADGPAAFRFGSGGHGGRHAKVSERKSRLAASAVDATGGNAPCLDFPSGPGASVRRDRALQAPSSDCSPYPPESKEI